MKKITPKKIIFIVASLVIIFGFSVYMRYLVKNLPSIHTLEDYTPSLVSRLYDINGDLITELFIERRTLIPLQETPVDLQNAVLAIEDDKFYSHWGISLKGIIRAAMNNFLRKRIAQGGSTITQQLSKTIFLTPERTYTRKLKELLLTLQLEYYYTKAEILQLYLNQSYFGAGAYGVKAAAKTYFNKEVKDMNLAECATLAGLLRAPNYYSPFKDAQRSAQRRTVVLRRMQELGFISKTQEAEADAFPVNTIRPPKEYSFGPYFAEYVRISLEPKYGKLLYTGGLHIYTTLDLTTQKAAEQAVENYLSQFDQERLTMLTQKNPSHYTIEKSTPLKVQGALIAIDPKTGGIRAMVGGRSFKESQFNRSYQAMRQPGSVFKPFIYAAALENGFKPTTLINDSPLVYVNDGRDWRLAARTTDYLQMLPQEWLEDPMKVWAPANYKEKYNGKVTLRKALERSMNMCSIQILDEIGPLRVIEYARKMGITSSLTNTLSLALGASDVTLMEITRAIGVFANNGILIEPYAIIRVEDSQGKVLEESVTQETDVLAPQTAYIMTNLLQGVVQNGTGQAAKYLRRPCAGKTGTTNDYSDVWFVGFTPQLVAGVWVGFDDASISLGEKMTGGRIAAPIWTDFMYKALMDKPVLNFQPTNNIVFSLVDPKTGLLALSKTPGAYLEAFVKGTEPKEYYYQYKETSDKDTEVIIIPPKKENTSGKIAGEQYYYNPAIPEVKNSSGTAPGAPQPEEKASTIQVEFHEEEEETDEPLFKSTIQHTPEPAEETQP